MFKSTAKKTKTNSLWIFPKLCNVVKFFNFLSLIFDSVFRFPDSIPPFYIPCELLCAAAAAEFLACVAGGIVWVRDLAAEPCSKKWE